MTCNFSICSVRPAAPSDDLFPDVFLGWGWIDDLILLDLLGRYYYVQQKKKAPANVLIMKVGNLLRVMAGGDLSTMENQVGCAGRRKEPGKRPIRSTRCQQKCIPGRNKKSL
jgi:hypothetical protein